MSREPCLICKFNGKMSHETSPNVIYQTGGSQRVFLCYVHSIEFFKLGQMKFLVKYKSGFEAHGLNPRQMLESSGDDILALFA